MGPDAKKRKNQKKKLKQKQKKAMHAGTVSAEESPDLLHSPGASLGYELNESDHVEPVEEAAEVAPEGGAEAAAGTEAHTELFETGEDAGQRMPWEQNEHESANNDIFATVETQESMPWDEHNDVFESITDQQGSANSDTVLFEDQKLDTSGGHPFSAPANKIETTEMAEHDSLFQGTEDAELMPWEHETVAVNSAPLKAATNEQVSEDYNNDQFPPNVAGVGSIPLVSEDAVTENNFAQEDRTSLLASKVEGVSDSVYPRLERAIDEIPAADRQMHETYNQRDESEGFTQSQYPGSSDANSSPGLSVSGDVEASDQGFTKSPSTNIPQKPSLKAIFDEDDSDFLPSDEDTNIAPVDSAENLPKQSQPAPITESIIIGNESSDTPDIQEELFTTENDVDVSKGDLPWEIANTEESDAHQTLEDATKFSFLQDDDDLLEDDDSLLESDDEVLQKESTKQEADKASYIPQTAAPVQQLPIDSYHSQPNPYQPPKPSFVRTVSTEPGSFSQSSSFDYSKGINATSGVTGVVHPKFINNSSASSNSSYEVASDIYRKLDEAKHKTDAYDFPMDLVKQEIKRGKPVNVTNPTVSIRQSSFSASMIERPQIHPPERSQSTLNNVQKPFYAELPLPKIDHSRAAPVHIAASQANTFSKPSSPQPQFASNRRSSIEARINPYAPKIRSNSSTSQPQNVVGSLGNRTPASPSGVQRDSLSVYANHTQFNSTTKPGASKPYAPSSIPIAPDVSNGLQYQTGQIPRQRTYTGASTDSAASFNGPSISFVPPVGSKDKIKYSFPQQNIPPDLSVVTEHSKNNFAGANPPPIISPVNSNPNTTRRTHARSHSSVYAPANHAHSSKYAPTVQPQFQQAANIKTSMSTHQRNLPIRPVNDQPEAVQYSSPHEIMGKTSSVPINNVYLMRHQFPIFHWGKSSKVIFGLPSKQDYMVAGEPKLETLTVCSYDNVASIEKSLEEFPGPLVRGKTKPKDVAKWLETYLEIKRQQGLDDLSSLLEILLIRLDSPNDIKRIKEELFSTDLLNTYLSQPFMPRISNQNAHKLDGIALTRVMSLLQVGAHDQALSLTLASKDYAMALLLGSILGKDKWSSVVDQYLNEELQQSKTQDNDGINLLSTIFHVFIGNAQKVIDSLKMDGTKRTWAVSNWRVLISSILSNSEGISTNGVLSPLVLEFLLQFGEFLIQQGMLIPGAIAFIIAETPMSETPLIPRSNVTFEAIGNANCFESLLLSEIYEFTYNYNDPTFSGFSSLLPQKIVHAAALSDYGCNTASTKYLDAAQSLVKTLPRKSVATVSLLRFIDDLSNQLSSSNVGWLGKPKLSSVWGQLDKSFNKFIGGDTDIDEADKEGKEDNVFDKFTPSSSRNPSVVDLTQTNTNFTPAMNRPYINQQNITNTSLIKTSVSKLSSGQPIPNELRLVHESSQPRGPSVPSNGNDTTNQFSFPTPPKAPEVASTPVGKSSPRIGAINNHGRFPDLRKPQQYNEQAPVQYSHFNIPTDGTGSLHDGNHTAFENFSLSPSGVDAHISVDSVRDEIYSQLPPLQTNKKSTHTKNKQLPLESLFDESTTPNISEGSVQTLRNEQAFCTEDAAKSPVDEIVEEIEHEIDAEIDEMHHSEFSDEEPIAHKDVALQEEQKLKLSHETAGFPPTRRIVGNGENITNISHEVPSLSKEFNTTPHGSADMPSMKVLPSDSGDSPDRVSSLSVSPGASSPRKTSGVNAQALNPYAPQARQSASVQQKPSKPYNPYAPSVISGTHSQSTVPEDSQENYSEERLSNTPIYSNEPNDFPMYAYGNYQLSEEMNTSAPNVPAELNRETASSPSDVSKVSETLQNTVERNPRKHSILPPHFNDDAPKLAQSEIKDPVIRPVQNSSFTSYVAEDAVTDQYYDDVVDDTDDEDDKEEGSSAPSRTTETEGSNYHQDTPAKANKLSSTNVIDEVDSDDEKTKATQERKRSDQSGKGWLGWFKKESNEKKPIKAKLGHKNNFYYDEQLKRWVNKDVSEEEKVKVASPAPPPPVVKRKVSKTPETKPRQGSVVGGPALRTAHAVMPTNPITGKPLDPAKDLSDMVDYEPRVPLPTSPQTSKPSINLTGSKANGLDDIMALTMGANTPSSTRRKKRSTRGYVNVMETL